MSVISLASVALAGVNTKKDEIKRDGEYYFVCVGGLNIFNSSGGFYDAAPSLPVFDEAAAFNRKVLAGAIYGEDRHPLKEPWMTDEDFYQRNERVEEDRRALFVREIKVIKTDRICNNLPVYEIWAWLKPFGVMGDQLKSALDDPHQNVCFSIRAWCLEKKVNGVTYYAVDEPLFFDWVQEPGIAIANKFYAEYDHKINNAALPRHMQVESIHHPITDRNIANLIEMQNRVTSDGKRLLARESYLNKIVDKYRENAAGLIMPKGGILERPFGG